MKEAKVGDLLLIKDYGPTYTTYTRWAKKYNLKNYIIGGVPKVGQLYEIRCIGEHNLAPASPSILIHQITMLAGIRDLKTKQEYVYGLSESSRDYYKIIYLQPEFDF